MTLWTYWPCLNEETQNKYTMNISSHHCLKSERFWVGRFRQIKILTRTPHIDKAILDPWCSNECHLIHFYFINALNSFWKLFESLNQMDNGQRALHIVHVQILFDVHITEIRLSIAWQTTSQILNIQFRRINRSKFGLPFEDYIS